MAEIKLDNTAVSKYPKGGLQYYAFLSIIFIGIVPIPLTIMAIQMGGTFEFSLMLSYGITTTVTLSIIILARSREIFTNHIILTNDNILLTRKSNEKRYPYENIMKILVYDREKIGNPNDRWFAQWNTGSKMRIIYLTEKNAKILAKKLDKKGIDYLWRNK